MRSILVLASTYPRRKNDSEPLFVHYLCEQLNREYRVIALVPQYPSARRQEDMDGVLVHRFRYFLPAGECLAFNGDIIQNLKKNRLKLLLVPFFLISQYIRILVLGRKYNISLIHAHWVIPQGLLALLARPLLPGKIKILSTSHGGDLFSLCQLEKIDDRLASRDTTGFRNLVNLLPIYLSSIRKEQDGVVSRGRE